MYVKIANDCRKSTLLQAMFNIRKIPYRHVRKDDARSESFLATLISMLGDHYDNVKELSSYIYGLY